MVGFDRRGRQRLAIMAAVIAIALLPGIGGRAQEATPVAPAAGGYADAPAGLLLVAPALSRATPEPRGLAVLDPSTGKTVATIDLANVVRLIPTRLPGVALAVTIDDELFVVDAAAGTATRLALPAGIEDGDLYAFPYQLSTATGRRYLLLGDGSGRKAVLVDLETASAHDLVAPIAAAGSGIGMVLGAEVSPDDARVLVWDGSDSFLIATASPETAVRLSDAGTALRPAFSPDGRSIAMPELKNRAGTLVLFDADGSNRRSVLNGKGPLTAAWYPDGKRLLALVFDPDANATDLVSVDPATEQPDTRASVPFLASRAWVTADGERALVGSPGDETAPWTLVELASGRTVALPDLTGAYVPDALSPGAEQIVFVAASGAVSDAAGGYYAVDLHVGSVTPLLTEAEGTVYLPPAAAPDGSALLLPTQTGNAAALWLLDAATGQATKLADKTGGAFGTFSPDGCRIAMMVYTGSGDTATTVVQVTDRTGAAPVELGPGRIPLWLAME